MRGKHLGLLSLTAVAMALSLAACGGDPTATPTVAPTATPPPQAAPTPDAAALFEAEWAALIEAAQAEGQVVLTFGGSAGRNFRPEAGLKRNAVGMHVEAAVLRVRDSGADVGQQHLGDALHALCEAVGCVLDVG